MQYKNSLITLQNTFTFILYHLYNIYFYLNLVKFIYINILYKRKDIKYYMIQ